MSEYSNTGYARYINLTISKGSDSSTLSILNGFKDPDSDKIYQPIQQIDWGKLSTDSYWRRVNAFVAYVAAQFPGLASDVSLGEIAQANHVQDLIHCQLPQEAQDNNPADA